MDTYRDVLSKCYEYAPARDYQRKRVNPQYRPYIQLHPVLPRILLARCVNVFVENLYRFASKQRKTSYTGDVVFDILITSKGTSSLGII